MKIKNQSSRLEITIAVVIIASMLALSVIVLVTQEADAASAASTKVIVKQTQVNKCKDNAKCVNTGTITFGSGVGHSGPGHH